MADSCRFIFRQIFEFYLGPGFRVPPSSQLSPLPGKILVFTFTRVHGCCMELSYNYSNSELGFCGQYFSPRSTYFMSSQMLLPFQPGNLAGPAYHIIQGTAQVQRDPWRCLQMRQSRGPASCIRAMLQTWKQNHCSLVGQRLARILSSELFPVAGFPSLRSVIQSVQLITGSQGRLPGVPPSCSWLYLPVKTIPQRIQEVTGLIACSSPKESSCGLPQQLSQ